MEDLNGNMMGDLSNIFKGFVIDKDEPLWDKLIQQIIDGNVIPVIGADLLVDNCLIGNSSNLHNFIIDNLAKGFQLRSSPKTFSELAMIRIIPKIRIIPPKIGGTMFIIR